MPHFSDRLAEVVRRKGPLCVGLDPRWESVPKELRDRFGPDGLGEAYAAFGEAVLELVEPHCGIVKPQAAFFEAAGEAGDRALRRLIDVARSQYGLLTILDAKRGDIASTATAYAQSAFDGYGADALTVNPYLGADAVEPFISAARAATPKRGLFVLVRTSNPGGGLFQNLVCNGRPLYRIVGEEVAKWNDGAIGDCGLGDVGTVVGATNPKEMAELRSALPKVWFLVPGYGAQGGTAADVRSAFLPNGLGAIVNSSRGVTFPFHPDDPNWREKIATAAERACAELDSGVRAP